FWRGGLERGDRRADPVRHAVHYSVCADPHERRAGSLCCRRGIAPWHGMMPNNRREQNAARRENADALIVLANPTRFLRIADRLLPWLIGATALLFAIGIYYGVQSPDDYQQGATAKIMF